MNRSIIFLVATVATLACLQIVSGEDEEGTFNIIEGNCTSALARDMVFREHVYKYFIPLVERNATTTWYGDEKIYCVKALNENDETEGGIAFIKDGGVGHHYITIEMHSKKGNTLEYDVEIYGR